MLSSKLGVEVPRAQAPTSATGENARKARGARRGTVRQKRMLVLSIQPRGLRQDPVLRRGWLRPTCSLKISAPSGGRREWPAAVAAEGSHPTGLDNLCLHHQGALLQVLPALEDVPAAGFDE